MVHRHGAGEADDPRLGCRVGGAARPADQAVLGAHGDDPGAAADPQQRERRAADVEGAGQVHRQRARPVRQAGLADVAGVAADPGHVDHGGQPAQPLPGRGDRGPHLLRVGDVGLDGGDAIPADGEPGDRPAEGGAVAVEGGDGGPLGQAAGGNGQADAGGGTGDEHPYGGQGTCGGRAAVIVRHDLRVCVHKGRLSRTVRVNRDRNDHRPARWRRICAGLKGITTRGPLRSGACRVRIKRCIKGRDGHRHHARRPGNGEGGGQ